MNATKIAREMMAEMRQMSVKDRKGAMRVIAGVYDAQGAAALARMIASRTECDAQDGNIIAEDSDTAYIEIMCPRSGACARLVITEERLIGSFLRKVAHLSRIGKVADAVLCIIRSESGIGAECV